MRTLSPILLCTAIVATAGRAPAQKEGKDRQEQPNKSAEPSQTPPWLIKAVTPSSSARNFKSDNPLRDTYTIGGRYLNVHGVALGPISKQGLASFRILDANGKSVGKLRGGTLATSKSLTEFSLTFESIGPSVKGLTLSGLRHKEVLEGEKKIDIDAWTKSASDPEPKAAALLQQAKESIKAGNIDLAKVRLRLVLTDYPKTIAAKACKQLLQEISK